MKKIIMALIFVTTGLLGFAMHGKNATVQLAKCSVNLPGDLEDGIDFFHGTWKEALKKSDKEDKLIFLDAYASWCGPCKLMSRNTFTDSRVGSFFNANFINYKMDMEKHPEGPRLSKKYALKAYPTLYFVDENENVVLTTLGYQDAKQLIAFGQKALK
ncbi:MAG: DUF255 domain-containing protein [Crocinitomicaceae bacterium]|nr:DUF255 domain-containing protein [Crocinitomicaceae bacterium]